MGICYFVEDNRAGVNGLYIIVLYWIILYLYMGSIYSVKNTPIIHKIHHDPKTLPLII